MLAQDLHPWRVSYRGALAIQASLRAHLRLEPLPREIRLVAGTDVAYSAPTHRMYAAVVVVSLPDLRVVETRAAVCLARFPYIPGLFTFREVPPLLRAFSRLKRDPDVLVFDGHGLAHPRRFGLACHGGVLFDKPSVGCAKSRLVGEHGDPAPARGAWTELRADGEVVGAVLRTRAGVAPVYASIGHRADLRSSIELLLGTSTRFRIPEPIRLAHHATTALRLRADPRLKPPRKRDYPDFIRDASAPRLALARTS
jgi:deoxyribonuclease V